MAKYKHKTASCDAQAMRLITCVVHPPCRGHMHADARRVGCLSLIPKVLRQSIGAKHSD